MGRRQEHSLGFRSHLGCLTLLGSPNGEGPFLNRTVKPQHLPRLVIRNPRSQESVFQSATCHWQMHGGRGVASMGPNSLRVVPASQPVLGTSCPPTLVFLACQWLCFPCAICDLLIVKLLHLLMCSEQGLEPLGSKGLQRLFNQINTQGRETVGGFQESAYFELFLMQKQGSQRKDVRFNVCVSLPMSNIRSCC